MTTRRPAAFVSLAHRRRVCSATNCKCRVHGEAADDYVPDPAVAAWCWSARPRAIPTGGVFHNVKIPRTGYFGESLEQLQKRQKCHVRTSSVGFISMVLLELQSVSWFFGLSSSFWFCLCNSAPVRWFSFLNFASTPL